MEFILIVLIILVFLGIPLMQVRKQSRQLKTIREFQSQLREGMIVQTTSGLRGVVTYVGEHTVDLEIAPSVVTTWDRAAVLKLIDDAGATGIDAGAPVAPAETAGETPGETPDTDVARGTAGTGDADTTDGTAEPVVIDERPRDVDPTTRDAGSTRPDDLPGTGGQPRP
ncbi:preprotein translocase subunit YajC [Corynebacterium bovis]|uniref:Preprotein translocase subunit YajC n=1 Tax=Corynebacterium bovis TaxID=36808 RepID=A0A3R8R6C4_9CORY|nr:preprotein translocase subunit YajC [Corynebacterium bovis]RRO93305.1 preprotein translocase subunit YajC [Corynebacterium bovis]RRO94307.1 preprotein translocase subunit YajC [Corynebacterium bovis]RRQ00192.1 preprotein translocase subunit YajC [Corynebacterium bovis]RRQ01099.1 preprotein translocase subunit YajC [Corynebacterium bovis]RRQ04722.1 preprotein translocase subunit YajC [Corynebacterium bovis]